jgi:RimJ/RimL family protein N-acetyltransferase
MQPVVASKTAQVPESFQVQLRALVEEDHDALHEFALSLPDDDLRYLEEDFQSPDIIQRLVHAHAAENWRQIVAVTPANQIAAYSSVRRLPGWLSNVGDIKLLVAKPYRHSGLGTAMGEAIFEAARELGVSKLIAEMIIEQQAGQAIFEHLGFKLEAVLEKHVSDRDDQLHNLVIMSYFIENAWRLR